VGRIDRKKNLSLLVEAFACLKSCTSFDGKLVLVGQAYQKLQDTELQATIERLGLHDAVILLDSVTDQELPALFSAAEVAVSTSLYEGFGIAPLEAMACGTPLIVHRAGSLGEVVGDAAIVLNSRQFEPLVHALLLVTQQPALRDHMRRKGLVRAQQFAWAKAARQTLALYEQVAA